MRTAYATEAFRESCPADQVKLYFYLQVTENAKAENQNMRDLEVV